MDKQILKSVILEWQDKELPYIVPRKIDVPLNSNKAITITGPRRSGKTYFFYQLIKRIIKLGIQRSSILYINFDDPRLLPANAMTIERILESFKELYPDYKKNVNYIFLDEIQNVKDWEIGVRRIYDTEKFRIYLTGSSSKFLEKEIATQLRGRAINFRMLPFSFTEMLSAKNIKLEKNIVYSPRRFQIIKILNEYLDTGGFPEVVLENNYETKLRILKEYIKTMFFRDLIERYNIKNRVVLRVLMKYLATNVSNIFSVNSFFKWISKSYPISRQTLINYISFLEDSGLFFLVDKYTFSQKSRSWFLRKLYIVDSGLRKMYGFKFTKDAGRIMENAVFLELKRIESKNPLMNIFYYQDYQHHEVDFVIQESEKVKTLLQVSANIEDDKTKRREISSLIKASERVKCNDLEVITLEYENIENIENKKITFVPLWKWLINIDS